MKAKECLDILVNQIHTVIIATNNQENHPITCAIDIMLSDDDNLYFLTAKGKNFYQRLINSPYISLTGIKGEDTMHSIAISINGKVKNIGSNKLDEIFAKNPYMKEIYPNEDARNILKVFQIYEGIGEYFDLSKKPIERYNFTLGVGKLKEEGYFVTDTCIGCKLCYKICPQKCIDITNKPVVINQKHCLYCGKCAEICPKQAIIRRG